MLTSKILLRRCAKFLLAEGWLQSNWIKMKWTYLYEHGMLGINFNFQLTLMGKINELFSGKQWE